MSGARRATATRTVGATVSALTPRRLLLDTHTWLWLQNDDLRLGARARHLIQRAPEVRVSAASAWEIAIKISIGKLTLPPNADINAELEFCGFLALPIDIAHAGHMRQLALLHRDPFDRLPVAQAIVEGLTLVTADTQLASYGVSVADARL